MEIVLYDKSWSKLYIRAVLLNNGTSLMFRCSKMLLRCWATVVFAFGDEIKMIKTHFTFCWKRGNFIYCEILRLVHTHISAKCLLGSSPAGFTAVDWRISFVKVGRALGWAFPVSRCQCSLRLVFSLIFLCTRGEFSPLSWDWFCRALASKEELAISKTHFLYVQITEKPRQWQVLCQRATSA